MLYDWNGGNTSHLSKSLGYFFFQDRNTPESSRSLARSLGPGCHISCRSLLAEATSEIGEKATHNLKEDGD
jgi:hypothetical protein